MSVLKNRVSTKPEKVERPGNWRCLRPVRSKGRIERFLLSVSKSRVGWPEIMVRLSSFGRVVRLPAFENTSRGLIAAVKFIAMSFTLDGI